MSFLDESYWEFEGRRFHGKYAALKAAGDPQKLRFHFFDDHFARWDWLTEPRADLFELMKLRARQLREKYKYVRLFYSGGADSHTALRMFLEQGLPIDEIVMFRFSPSGEFTDLGNVEINEVAVPFLQSRAAQLEKTKITFLDFGYEHFRRFYSIDGWIDTVNRMHFRLASIPHKYLLFPELGEIHERETSACDLFGGDKPRLEKENDRYYSFYWDGAQSHSVGGRFVEEFYITPDVPDLHIKQCHVVKNYLKLRYAEAELRPFFLPKAGERDALNALIRYPLYRDINVGKTFDCLTPKNISTLRQAKEKAPDILRSYEGFLAEAEHSHRGFFNGGLARLDFAGVRTRRYDLGT